MRLWSGLMFVDHPYPLQKELFLLVPSNVRSLNANRKHEDMNLRNIGGAWTWTTRWAPTSYRLSYSPYKWPYKWVTGVVTLHLEPSRMRVVKASRLPTHQANGKRVRTVSENVCATWSCLTSWGATWSCLTSRHSSKKCWSLVKKEVWN